MKEKDFVEKVKSVGGRVFRVGGCVRDMLLGKTPKDRDYVLTGVSAEGLFQLFADAKPIGKSFPVFLVEIDGEKCEVSLARRERKTGTGYCGFEVSFDKDVTIEEDLYRRDTTVNSMAVELPMEELLDPYGGAQDVKNHILRAVSEHFMEDPVRALRVARQAAEHNFSVTEETYAYMKKCAEELKTEPPERILHEMELALEAEKPSIFFRTLQRAGLLEIAFPEIFALIGKTQPAAFHPEGDAYEHVLLVLDRVAAQTKDVVTRFSALAHDIGKGVTPLEVLPHHYGHEEKGVEVLQRWNARMTLPKLWMMSAEFVIREHMRAPLLEKPGKMVDLLLRIQKSKLSVKAFNFIIQADHGSLPFYLSEGERILEKLLAVSGGNCPKVVKGKFVGEWIRSERIRKFQSLRMDFEQ